MRGCRGGSTTIYATEPCCERNENARGPPAARTSRISRTRVAEASKMRDGREECRLRARKAETIELNFISLLLSHVACQPCISAASKRNRPRTMFASPTVYAGLQFPYMLAPPPICHNFPLRSRHTSIRQPGNQTTALECSFCC